MIDYRKEIGRYHMRVQQDAFEIVHRHDRHVGFLQQLRPFRRVRVWKMRASSAYTASILVARPAKVANWDFGADRRGPWP